MAATKSRGLQDDSRSEASSTKERPRHAAVTALNGKARRVPSNLGTAITMKESVNSSAASAAAVASVTGPGQDGVTGIQWPTLEHSTLHSYRHAYKLNTPSAFRNPYNQLILSRPGIGRFSPTMARRKDHRPQSKEQLATAIRKHFNGQGIQENDAVVEFLYKTKHQDKAFRLRFTPQKAR